MKKVKKMEKNWGRDRIFIKLPLFSVPYRHIQGQAFILNPGPGCRTLQGQAYKNRFLFPDNNSPVPYPNCDL
jgi:hypothetical protein